MTLRKYNFATVCTWAKTKRDTRCQFEAEAQAQAQALTLALAKVQSQSQSRLGFSLRLSHKSQAAATTFWAWYT